MKGDRGLIAYRSGNPSTCLDRPNPINASVVQGPVTHKGLLSFAGYIPLPVRHGVTVGELAWLFNAEERIGAQLTMMPMRGYQRYDQIGLSWVNPSPNLHSVDATTLSRASG